MNDKFSSTFSYWRRFFQLTDIDAVSRVWHPPIRWPGSPRATNYSWLLLKLHHVQLNLIKFMFDGNGQIRVLLQNAG